MQARRSSSNRDVMVLAAVAIVALMAVAVAVKALPDCPEDAVYPYWSMCFQPAKYYGEEVYQITSTLRATNGSLAPEWDESNSTYYVRLSDVGATYKFVHFTKELRFYVHQSDDVIIMNVDTNRALAWRQEGEDEYFLVEEEFGTDGFQFAVDKTVVLSCPFILGARCEAYQILNFGTSLGLAQYEEDGAIYFKQANSSSDALLPFVLLRSSSSSGYGDVQLKMPA